MARDLMTELYSGKHRNFFTTMKISLHYNLHRTSTYCLELYEITGHKVYVPISSTSILMSNTINSSSLKPIRYPERRLSALKRKESNS